MTVTLNLPPEIERALSTEAQAKGVSVDELVQGLLIARQPRPAPHELSAEEWIRRFHAWVASHEGMDLPVLTDEAMSREFIYRGHPHCSAAENALAAIARYAQHDGAVLISHPPTADPKRLPYEEWHRRWEEFLANRPPTDVVLPDEAMERESIYGDRGAVDPNGDATSSDRQLRMSEGTFL